MKRKTPEAAAPVQPLGKLLRPDNGAASYLLVALAPEQLDKRIEGAVTRVMEALRPAAELLDKQSLARALDVSASTVSRLRAAGMPCVMVLDSPRFRYADVIDWLVARGYRAGEGA